ncbi:hypothetical protein PAPYR_2894 [Paratrimastix pyriformis]|uniref:Uncharacterized protein n=1 Tax=Paratrimastix pyriformis TaxID=342808 RepID=A0ABQ8UNC2_9EUKA|nr:hypothetical protein PAPYR_2894 [Paratrimastix pyriformis]
MRKTGGCPGRDQTAAGIGVAATQGASVRKPHPVRKLSTEIFSPHGGNVQDSVLVASTQVVSPRKHLSKMMSQRKCPRCGTALQAQRSG